MKIDINNIEQEIKDAIIKDYMFKYYHWTVGIGAFLLGTFFGLLIK
jgi:hypothetical protein